LNVKRQGEWFFIPTTFKPETELTERQKTFLCLNLNQSRTGLRNFNYSGLGDIVSEEFYNAVDMELQAIPDLPGPMTLQAGKNRPNNAQIGVKDGDTTYVKGEISHTGREHKTIKLKEWHTAHCNTAFTSHTIAGDID